MGNRLLHTPEGVRDSYSTECSRKLALEQKILKVLYLYGYEHIETPSFDTLICLIKTEAASAIGKCLNFLIGTTRLWC